MWMANNWTPPKGINIIYKGKGFRKKAKPSKEHDKEEGAKKSPEAEKGEE